MNIYINIEDFLTLEHVCYVFAIALQQLKSSLKVEWTTILFAFI